MEGAKDQLVMRLLEDSYGECVVFRRRGSRSEFFSRAWARYVVRDDWATGDAGESCVCRTIQLTTQWSTLVSRLC